MLIQVKGDAMSWKEFDRRVKPKIKSNGNGSGSGEHDDEENAELIYILNEKDFADKDTSIKNENGKLGRLNSGCAAYMKEHGEILKENGFKTFGIYMYVPSVIDGQSMIDINGQPDKKLNDFISKFMDLKLPDIAKK